MGYLSKAAILFSVLFLAACTSSGRIVESIDPETIAPQSGKGQLVLYRTTGRFGAGVDTLLNPYGFAQTPKVSLSGSGLVSGGTHSACRYNSSYIINLPAGRYTVALEDGEGDNRSISVDVSNGRRTFVKCTSVQGAVGINMELESVANDAGEKEIQRTGLIANYSFN